MSIKNRKAQYITDKMLFLKQKRYNKSDLNLAGNLFI